jgi:hypothetical protein
MRYTDDPLSIIYENQFLSSNKIPIQGSANSNNGIHANKQFVTSLIGIMHQIWNAGGNFIDFVEHLRSSHDIRYENIDSPIQRDILKQWTQSTGDRNPLNFTKGNLSNITTGSE